MKLENGFKLEGVISNSIVQINDEWRKILIVKSDLEEKQLRELFKDNNYIINYDSHEETTYYTDGLICIKENIDKNKRYVWLYFKNSTSRDIVTREEIEELKTNQEKTNDAILSIMDMI